jgi:DNA modification methylase
MKFSLFCGDVLDGLRMLPGESVDCVVTSPPYWRLRDYGVGGQIGLESSPDEYVAKMVLVFGEVRRVLKKRGTVWLNLGDSYASQPAGNKTPSGFSQTRPSRISGNGDQETVDLPQKDFVGLKPKDLCGVPWRVAFALQADGWWLRQDIIWSKPNPMPESVTDRCTKAHEYVFLLSKAASYYYDNEAIREDSIDPESLNGLRERNAGTMNAVDPKNYKFHGSIGEDGKRRSGQKYKKRNKRSVWTITTKPYSGAHFATFPEDLIEPMIRAGTSEKGVCPTCGKPWERIIEASKRYDHITTDKGKSADGPYHAQIGEGEGTHDIRHGVYSDVKTLGWRPSCSCSDEFVPAVVLDPFAGSGTTMAVARRLGRDAVGIELNPAYVKLIKERLRWGEGLGVEWEELNKHESPHTSKDGE